jgi:hypothetical protein
MSGTAQKPVPTGANLQFTVGTTPTGFRPKVVETYKIAISGVSQNTSSFPVCASSRLIAPKQGPSTCEKRDRRSAPAT